MCRFEGFRRGRFRSGDNGPGANVGAAPSGRDFLPPPGHGGPVVWNKERKRLEHKEGAFSLGRYELPVAVGALAWSAFVLFVLVSPSEALVPVVIVVGLLILGGLYFGYLLRFRREVLQTEPGDVSVFKY